MNIISSLTCKVVELQNSVADILRRITPIQYVPGLSFRNLRDTSTSETMGTLIIDSNQSITGKL